MGCALLLETECDCERARELERDPPVEGRGPNTWGPRVFLLYTTTSFFSKMATRSLFLAPLVLAESSPTSLLVIWASPVALLGACFCWGFVIFGNLDNWGFGVLILHFLGLMN